MHFSVAMTKRSSAAMDVVDSTRRRIIANWFYVQDFHYDSNPVGEYVIAAYVANFKRRDSSGTMKICFLHNDAAGSFPYKIHRRDETARQFAISNGLTCVGDTSYGYVSRSVFMQPYDRCCSEEWVGWYCKHCHTQR